MHNPEFTTKNLVNAHMIARGVRRFGVDAFDTAADASAPQGPTAEQMKARRRRASARMVKAKTAKSSRRRNRVA